MSRFFFENDEGRWFKEAVVPQIGHSLKAENVLFEDQSEHQHLVVLENDIFGRVLALNGFVQVSTADEFIYHEMVAHVPVLAHGGAKRVLVIGGGDGGTCRELFRHQTIEHVTLVEIERDVIDFTKKWLPSIPGEAFNDPRLDLVIADGAQFVKDTDQRYDVVIIDSTDPVGPGEVLFTEEFYRDCAGLLTPGGIMVTQSGLPFLQPTELKQGYDRMRTSFADVSFYAITVPAYSGGIMTLGFASQSDAARTVSLDTLEERAAATGIRFRYYAPDVHRAAFALPVYVRDILAD